jgi:hypothetical protein
MVLSSGSQRGLIWPTSQMMVLRKRADIYQPVPGSYTTPLILFSFAYLCVLCVERVSGLNFSVCPVDHDMKFGIGEN